MLDLGFGIVAVGVAVAMLAFGLKLVVGLLKALLVLLLLPFHLLAAVLALVGGVLLLPAAVLVALLVVVALIGGLVIVPLAPFALLALGIVATVRLLRPRRG